MKFKCKMKFKFKTKFVEDKFKNLSLSLNLDLNLLSQKSVLQEGMVWRDWRRLLCRRLPTQKG